MNFHANVVKQRFYFKVLQHRDNAICWPFIEAESAEAAKISGLFEDYYPDGYTILAEYTEDEWRINRPWESDANGK